MQRIARERNHRRHGRVTDKPRFLVIAYACRPEEGSEAGAGWTFARIAAGIGPTWVLHRPRPDTAESVKIAATSVPEAAGLHLVPVVQPFLTGRKSATADYPAERLEYMLWQARAVRAARSLVAQEQIDVVWHVSWSTVWLGSLGWLAGRKFVWGPVGGGVGPPWPLLGTLGGRGIATELARWAVQLGGRWFNPLVRIGASRASLILAQNAETKAWLPRSAHPRTQVFHHVAVEADQSALRPRRRLDRPPTAMFAGRLLAWKGPGLAIDAVARTADWNLVVCGEGPELSRLRDRAAHRGIASRVRFVGRVARDELLSMMREQVDAFLFPSLHEEGGWVVGEAVANGLPVVTVDRGGPAAIAGGGVPLGTPEETATRLAAELDRVLSGDVVTPPAPTFERRRSELTALLASVGLLDGIDP